MMAHVSSRSWVFTAALALVGCSGDKLTLETGAPPESPCADGSWGIIADPSVALHVRADGDDSGDGSLDSPVATLDRAHELSRARDEDKVIFIGPGRFQSLGRSLESEPLDGGSDDGTTLAGCPGEVTLTPPREDRFSLRVSEARDVTLADLDLEGGEQALWIRSGAKVSVARLSVRSPIIAGVLIDGHDTLVDIEDLSVDDTEEDVASGLGVGVVVIGASITWRGGRVSGSRGVGVFVDGDSVGGVNLSSVAIDETEPDATGALGRGLHAQRVATLALSELTLADNADAGVFALQSFSTTLSQIQVDTVYAASLDSGEDTGDGVVVTSRDEEGLELDPTDFPVALSDSVVTGAARAGLTLEAVEATLDGNSLSGELYAAVTQEGATVSGSDSELAEELSGSDILDLNRALLEDSFLEDEVED